MAKTQINMSQMNFQATVNMLLVTQGAKKVDTELKGVRGKVTAFKKNMEDSGLKPLDFGGFVSGGGLIKPFQEGLKKAIKVEDELAKKAKGIKAPPLPRNAVIPKPPALPKDAVIPKSLALPKDVVIPKAPVASKKANAPKVALGETSDNLARFNATLDAISLKIGQALIPAVNGIITALLPMMTSIGQFVANNPQLVQGLAAAAVAFTVITTAAMGFTAVMGVLVSPIGIVAAAIAVAAGLIVANWKPISTFFAGLWQKIAPVVIPMAKFFKTMFGFTPLGQLISNWGPVMDFFSTLWGGIKSVAAPVIEFYKTLFSWTPQGQILSNWMPLVNLFSSIWDLLAAVSVPVKDFLQGLFNWSPLEVIQAIWGGVVSVFSSIWDSIKMPFIVTYAIIRSELGWSPLEQIMKAWEPVTAWVREWWGKLQNVIAPIRNFFSGGFGALIAEATAKVNVLTQAQEKTNAEGKGEFSPSFFGADSGQPASPLTTPGNVPQASSMQPGSLKQTSNTLIQQSAANNRTQLEGGLTVRFENAPAGLRTDQPQTNQPALMLNSRIGYRSLSLGGSNELA
ncbi:phage tail protein [Pseudomonas sp. N3-W]|uniref:phage tail protein n=1 Tax=Pseudomonas sp. N3-W TaxID=2975049 RepID=UPI00217D4D96|nr:phage tail protein [Pseudomonas sp. N3-W]UWF50542.1 phage tail protein [Pseudomonas sp. N3-W]